jgi:hypothetical protein
LLVDKDEHTSARLFHSHSSQRLTPFCLRFSIMKIKSGRRLYFLSLLSYAVSASQTLRARRDRLLAPLAVTDHASNPAASNSTISTRPLLTIPLYNSDQTISDAIKANKIYGGVTAQPLEAPYFVMMLSWNNSTSKYEFDGCGGSLVSERHVLTAGHCAKDRDPRTHAVYVQAYQPSQANNSGVPLHFSRIANYTIHPRFNDTTNANDLSIVTLTTPVNKSSFTLLRPAGPYVTIWEGEQMQIYGFGYTNYTARTLLPTLQTVSLPFIPREKCKTYFGSHIQDDMVCAGFQDGGHDACNGDSGGPMVVKKGNQTFQVGIVDWGQGCGQPNKPGVYISVQYHFKWIQETICSALERNATAAVICDHYVPSPLYSASSINGCTKSKIGEQCGSYKQCCSGVCALGNHSSTTKVCAKAASW